MLKFLKRLFSQTPETEKPKQSPPKPSTPETYVFVTLRGKKFHYDPSCSSVVNSKTYKMDLSKARKGGYKACDKCCWSYLHE